MRAVGVVSALSVVIALGVGVAPPAHTADWALNGKYRATSNGDWATTNDVDHNEATVRSIWTVAMSCANVLTCGGTVVSDAGWTAEITVSNEQYYAKRDIPNWEPCADGRTVTGHQVFMFFPADDKGMILPGSSHFGGIDKTSGDTGACSINERLEIVMPFRLEKLD